MDALPSLETLFDLTEGRTHDGRETAPRYATAWALVDLLVLGAPDLAPRFQSPGLPTWALEYAELKARRAGVQYQCIVFHHTLPWSQRQGDTEND